jgi:DNA-binding CsgD family transcriptional regulator
MSPIPIDIRTARAAPGSPGWPALIERIGDVGFMPAMLGLCHELAGASDLSVFTLKGRVPNLVGAVSLLGDAARRAGYSYLSEHFYRLDDNLCIARSAARELCVSHVLAGQLADRHYRGACYDSAGLNERMSLLIPSADQWIIVNAYRPHHCAMSSGAALDALCTHAPALAAAARRHLALSAATPAPDGHEALAALSPRERQVVDTILAGRTAKEAGRLLGLSPTSVATYRQRAFEKLGVRRQLELFQRFGGVVPAH